jgi:hypothetical protein
MKRKVPYLIIGIIMLVALSSTCASAYTYKVDYPNQAITNVNAILVVNKGVATFYCNWTLNEAAAAQSNLTVDVTINDGTNTVTLGTHILASAKTFELPNANHTYFTEGLYNTVKVSFVNPGETPGSVVADNDKTATLNIPSNWFAPLVNGLGWIFSATESLTDQIPFDIPIIGQYLPMLIVFVVLIIIIWWYLRRRKRKKLAAGRQPIYRPPAPYQPPVDQQQYYRR